MTVVVLRVVPCDGLERDCDVRKSESLFWPAANARNSGRYSKVQAKGESLKIIRAFHESEALSMRIDGASLFALLVGGGVEKSE